MLSKFNQFIEKWMALVTPACLLFGVLFPDVAKHGMPYVSLVFAFMTFTGALKSDFHDMARVLKRPFPLLACLGVLHVLLPVLACGLGHLLFPGNDDLITGMVLEFSVPTAVVGLMWVTIYGGNSPLSLSLVIADTLLAPFSDSDDPSAPCWFPGIHGCGGHDEGTSFYDSPSGAGGDESQRADSWKSAERMAVEAGTFFQNMSDLRRDL